MAEIQDPRQEEKELMQKIQLGSRDPAIQALCRLLEIRLLRNQNQMLDCPHDGFLALQAEARVTAKLIKELKPKMI